MLNYALFTSGEKYIMGDTQTTIYYNPKCSKCRSTLELLKEKGKQVEVVEYLQDVPSKSVLQDLIGKLGISASQLLRKHESSYEESGLNEGSSEDEILDVMMKYPILIERPIVVHNGKAIIGRPPENILAIL